MKIPFPYWLAAEVYLFQPPAKKYTLVHFLTVGIPAVPSILMFVNLKETLPVLVAVTASILLFCVSVVVLYRSCCNFLPLLMKAVDRGIVQQPDAPKLEEQIRSNACWK